MKRNLKTAAICAFAVILSNNFIGTSAIADDHDKMHDEHSQALAEHDAWIGELGKMKVDHRRALAALAKLQAEILEHEAEIEAMSTKIQQHNNLMARHDHAIEKHESAGQNKKHDDLANKHNAIMETHAELGKSMKSKAADHADLIGGILKFVEKHMTKFHHGHGTHAEGGHSDHEGHGHHGDQSSK